MSTLQSDNSMNSHCIGRATKRLNNEYKKFIECPLENIRVSFQEDKIIEWHFLFSGLNDTPFEGGEYHGMLVFREDYPFSPPSIRFITPNGRFKTDEKVCFDLSDFHSECWKPAYTVSAVLQGVYSFMMSETTDTVGSLKRNENEIRELAGKSKEFNLQDDSAGLFQIENKAALTENSDTSPTNKPDISSSQKGQSNSSPDVLEPYVSSKEAKPNEDTETGGNLEGDKNIKMGLASKSSEPTKNVSAHIEYFESQPDNAKSPLSENTKLNIGLQSKSSHEITLPSKSTQTADQIILPDPVIAKGNNSTVASESISDPSQQSGSNGFNNSKEKQEDNVTSTSEPPEDSKHLPQHIVEPSKTQAKTSSTNDISENKPTTSYTTNATPHNKSLAPVANKNSRESGKPLKQNSKNDVHLQTSIYREKKEKSLPTISTSQSMNLNRDLSRKNELEEKGKKSIQPKILRITPKDKNEKSKS